MITTSKGYKIPENRDTGRPVFKALEDNFHRVDGHKHDGIDSVILSSVDIAKGSVTLPSTGWTAVTNVGFKRTLTFPSTYTLANAVLQFRIKSGAYANTIIHPTLNPVSITQLEVVVAVQAEIEVLFS